MIKETVKSADYTLVKYKDAATGKIKFRKKRHDDKIVKKEDVQEKAVSKAQQKFFGMVRAKQKGEMPNASPEVKKAAASMSKKDVKDFAATKHKGLPAKKESKEKEGLKNIKELSPDTVKRYRDKASDDQPRQKRIAHDYATRTGDNKSDWTDRMAKVHKRAADNRAKGIARANKKLGEAKTFEDFKSDLAKRKAANLAKRGARRGPAKGTAKKDGDWDQKAAKPLGFEIKDNDHHSTVHKTLAKAADAMHPSLGGRKVSLKLGGKTKVYSNHKDLQHVIDYHQKLKDKGQKAQLMRNVRDNGHDHISKVTNVYRKATGQ